MTCCRQCSRSAQHFVNRAVVNSTGWWFSVLCWHKPNDWHFSIQLLRVRVIKQMGCAIPTSTLHKHSVDISTIKWFLSDFINRVLVYYLKVKCEFINCNDVLSRKVLESRCEESLWENEPWNPERGWRSIFNPFGPEGNTFKQFCNPGGKRFERKEGILPLLWNLVIEETAAHLF